MNSDQARRAVKDSSHVDSAAARLRGTEARTQSSRAGTGNAYLRFLACWGLGLAGLGGALEPVSHS